MFVSDKVVYFYKCKLCNHLKPTNKILYRNFKCLFCNKVVFYKDWLLIT